jgi:hypothetical protein
MHRDARLPKPGRRIGVVLIALVTAALWLRSAAAQSPQPTRTPTATATPATPSPTPTPTAPAAVTPPPAATPAVTTTPAPTPVSQDVAQRLAPDCPGEHRDGPRQLTVRQPTRILVTCTVRNPLNEPVDYSATMVFTLGERASVADGGAQRGQVAVVGNEIRWGAFVLQPGESASAFAVVEVSPADADAGRPVVLFTSTRTTAQLAGGAVVTFVAGPFTSAEVSGLLGGGIVTTAPAAPAAPAQPTRPAPPAAGLPRTGAGPAGEPTPGPWYLLALAALAVPAVVTALRAQR